MINSFQSLFQGRQSVKQLQTEESIRSFIKSELLDEFTHPRARRAIDMKYAFAVNRIEQSKLTMEEKELLLSVYKEEYLKLSI